MTVPLEAMKGVEFPRILNYKATTNAAERRTGPAAYACTAVRDGPAGPAACECVAVKMMFSIGVFNSAATADVTDFMT